jgi:hypothetical protein
LRLSGNRNRFMLINVNCAAQRRNRVLSFHSQSDKTKNRFSVKGVYCRVHGQIARLRRHEQTSSELGWGGGGGLEERGEERLETAGYREHSTSLALPGRAARCI